MSQRVQFRMSFDTRGGGRTGQRARHFLAVSMMLGRFGLREIPEGFRQTRKLFAAMDGPVSQGRPELSSPSPAVTEAAPGRPPMASLEVVSHQVV
jgi:hypothetical protein